MRYRFVVSEEALAIYGRCSTRQRVRFEDAFAKIAEFPDYADRTWNNRGFTYCVRRFGNWNVAFRVDSPVKCVHILSLENLRK